MSKLHTVFLIVIACIFTVGAPDVVLARSISVTPTILEMFAVPGQVWSSSIKVINQNDDPLTIYTDTANFAPQGERGHGSFRPVPDDATDNTTLAEWMEVSEESYTIPPEGSINVPVTIRVPADAAPGGHYAAVMIGTKPPVGASMQVGTAQIISSLFFVRIEGDVVERGQIRTFRPRSRFVQTPEATFSVRFENLGNVHLQPQGEIVITNMWGRERGVIPINQKTHFGNVLPDSVREFEFTWSGDASFSDVGRYEATIALGYGNDQRVFLTERTYFWVVPLKPIATLLAVLVAIIWFGSWCVRAYVRRMLILSGVNPTDTRDTRSPEPKRKPLARLRKPLEDGVIDLRSEMRDSTSRLERLSVMRHFVVKYYRFFVAVLGLLIVVVLLWWFVQSVFVDGRNYDVTIFNNGEETTMTGEEILYERSRQLTTESDAATRRNETYSISVINATDTPGQGVAVADQLTAAGYKLAEVTSVADARPRTVVIYPPDLEEQALELSKLLDGALLSADSRTASSTEEASNIRIFVGEE